jgi:hypothetical protein
MKSPIPSEKLSPIARRAWKRLEAAFPTWQSHLSCRDGELEFALPAPAGSAAGHLVAFSNQNDLWLRFAPPYMCYAVDDENEMVSLIESITADRVVFRTTMKGEEWVETTLSKPRQRCKSVSGQTIHQVSWSGAFDKIESR